MISFDGCDITETVKKNVPYCSEIPERLLAGGYCLTHFIKFVGSPPHYHNHYELTLVASGCVSQVVNGEEMLLEEGSLCFIRPDDTHSLKAMGNKDTELLVLAFSIEHFDRFADYFAGTGFSVDSLVNCRLPEVKIVDVKEVCEIFNRFDDLRNKISNPSLLKSPVRRVVCRLMGYFDVTCRGEENETASVPPWLDEVCVKMRKYENFSAPIGRITELSGRSKEHLSRCMKKYMNITPSEYVYGLRVAHAAELLHYSTMSVLDICFSCGFENTAYFHKKFKEAFGMSPKKFRTVSRAVSI